MRRSDQKPIAAFSVVALSVGLGLASCSQTEGVVWREGPTPPGFGSADASADAVSVDVPMCPVTTCRPPFATCPSSEFPCSSDLSRDLDNCGGCGIHCGNGSPSDTWSCVGGQCRFACGNDGRLDCDDDPTNGCETTVDQDPDNCGACNVKCADGTWCDRGACVSDGCNLPTQPDACGDTCTDLTSDDLNCGTCGVLCDPAGPSLPALPSDMYYGCVEGACGKPKCAAPDMVDCNHDRADGCEAKIHTNDHCNACDDKCKSGKECTKPQIGEQYLCQCEDDRQSLCGRTCIQTDDDPQNCGGCFRVCPGLFRPHFSATCTAGVCGGRCNDDYVDCDGLADNGCEVNTLIDNRNCGACGNACLPNQVCAGGQCLVTPCDAGSSGSTTQ